MRLLHTCTDCDSNIEYTKEMAVADGNWFLLDMQCTSKPAYGLEVYTVNTKILGCTWEQDMVSDSASVCHVVQGSGGQPG